MQHIQLRPRTSYPFIRLWKYSGASATGVSVLALWATMPFAQPNTYASANTSWSAASHWPDIFHGLRRQPLGERCVLLCLVAVTIILSAFVSPNAWWLPNASSLFLQDSWKVWVFVLCPMCLLKNIAFSLLLQSGPRRGVQWLRQRWHASFGRWLLARIVENMKTWIRLCWFLHLCLNLNRC